MPLPAALAARLAKRGIVREEEVIRKAPVQSSEEVEEVYAEDYDDFAQTPAVQEVALPVPQPAIEEEPESDELIFETPGCPNRANHFHKCVDFCKTKWGFKKFEPDPKLNRKIERMLQKYPLPQGWMTVGDPETGRFYYWNTETDQVSWLSPVHPRSEVTFSAQKLKELMDTAQAEALEAEKDEVMETDDQNFEDQDFEEIERELLKEKRRRERKGRDRDRDRRRDRDKDELDPMDPAAYSDIPRGSWSTGLDVRGSAKTGVDSTASGPLFQQRPYPSPGAVLRANRQVDDD